MSTDKVQAAPEESAADKLMMIVTEGLVGCPTWQHFTLEATPEMAPIGVLRCLDEEGISFYVVHPRYIVQDYQVTLTDSDRELLELPDGGSPEVLCILVVRADPLTISANLLGPIVWNTANGRARQLVLANSGYSAQHLVRGGAVGGAAC